MLDERLSLFRRRLLDWYDANRRDLPWRVPMDAVSDRAPDPYHVLVSEAMLQQTQVATVIPYFERFIRRFPALADLASADEQDVLRLWQGLGYYSRARNLLAAARKVMCDCGGELPQTVSDLRQLPGVGRYTAGAVASIAFGRRSPILDGNVARVLCRLDAIEGDPRDRETHENLWRRAEQVLPRRDRIGDFNSALMELGATVCTPRSPQCLICPVNRHCRAFARGLQDRIPPPRPSKPTPLVHRWTFCIRRPQDDRWLLEQRPATGRWAGMWQFVTMEADGSNGASPTARTVRKVSCLRTSEPSSIGRVRHGLTHRRYEFEVFRCQTLKGGTLTQVPESGLDRRNCGRKWARLDELDRFPLPKPHVTICRFLRKEIAETP
jgi:A/G-specific adenine glycosylase